MADSYQTSSDQPTGTLPTSPGTYILHLHLNSQQNIRVGKLGEFTLPQGEYLYIGSAQGAGGLRGRLGRHMRRSERLHWHIDWLRWITAVSGYFYLISREHLECEWARCIRQLPGAEIPVPGFGASDCRNKGSHCAAHLVWFKSVEEMDELHRKLPVYGEARVEYQKMSPVIRHDPCNIE
ncbi:MAG: GIY-YIG nuclease family protein [Anaerolineales bacterium]|jgi:Uri superfamily endonuclease